MTSCAMTNSSLSNPAIVIQVLHVAAEIGCSFHTPAQSAGPTRQQHRLRPYRQLGWTCDGAVVRQRELQRAKPDGCQLVLAALYHYRHDIRIADEVGDEVAVRLLVEVARRPVLRDARHAHHDDAVGDRQRLLLVVRHVDHGERQAAAVARGFPHAHDGAAWRRGWTAARRTAAPSAPARSPAPPRRAAAGRPTVHSAGARRSRTARPATASPAPAPRPALLRMPEARSP